jgi:hypothetical protein
VADGEGGTAEEPGDRDAVGDPEADGVTEGDDEQAAINATTTGIHNPRRRPEITLAPPREAV